MTAPQRSQFMNIEQLKALPANDFSSDTYTHTGQQKRTEIIGEQPQHRDITVGQLSRDHPYYQYEKKEGLYDLDHLHSNIAEHGMKEPLHVAPGKTGEDRLMNGHHRAIVAQEAGHMFVPVTDSPSRTATTRFARPGPSRPTRTWEPLIQEHEDEANQQHYAQAKSQALPQVHYGQGVLFNHPGFNDRRSRGA
jgi:hypothetical protein